MQPVSDYSAPPGKKKSNNTWIWVVVGVIVICGCGGAGLLGTVLVPVFLRARNAARTNACVSNIKNLGRAELMYATDHDESLPLADSWTDSTSTYVDSQRQFSCPVVRRNGGQYGYAANKLFGGKKIPASKGDQVILFETSNLVRNANGDPSHENPPNRHGQGRTESYLDGHSSWVRSGRVPSESP